MVIKAQRRVNVMREKPANCLTSELQHELDSTDNEKEHNNDKNGADEPCFAALYSGAPALAR
jgi:hypothetical protein